MGQRLYLHCGMHKAGSSAIQDSLAAAPLPAPFQYLSLGAPNGSLAVSQAFAAGFRRRMERRGRKVSAEDLAAVRRRGRATIENAFSGWTAPRGIVSAEDISSLREAELAELQAMLAARCSATLAVIYVREPKSYLESAFQQVLKTFMPAYATNPLKLHFRERFAPFDRVFGRENVSIRWYARGALHNGCVVEDFGRAIGLRVEPSWVISSNRSLSLEAVKLLYVYRSVHGVPDPRDRAVIAFLREVRSARFGFHPDLAARLCHVDAAQQRWLAQRVGSDWPAREADGEAGVRSLGELLHPAPATLERLAAASDRPRTTLRSPEAIAGALRALALECAD